jgi:16S rRNA (guanine966-N2)-methyltransferase
MRKEAIRHSGSRLRIIGGEWRGRKLSFPEQVANLRPTPDRVRETLFNWLASRIHGANCLDLFAGSGALGLEALSRGASHCTFVDTANVATDVIRRHLSDLNANDRATIVCGDALQWQTRTPVDIVFLDPPYSAELVGTVIHHLHTNDLLASDARIYVELERNQTPPDLPTSLEVIRDKVAGSVRYQLLAVSDNVCL